MSRPCSGFFPLRFLFPRAARRALGATRLQTSGVEPCGTPRMRPHASHALTPRRPCKPRRHPCNCSERHIFSLPHFAADILRACRQQLESQWMRERNTSHFSQSELRWSTDILQTDGCCEHRSSPVRPGSSHFIALARYAQSQHQGSSHDHFQ
jgi:hypothetical protein